MTSRVPQLTVTLTPDGQLAVELPGHQSTRRQVILRLAEAGASLARMLEAQARDQTEIGLDGAPTVKQVQHWERHGVWASSQCRFCIAEGRAQPNYSAHRQSRKTLVYKDNTGVEVRIIKAGTKGHAVTKKTAQELGL